MSLDDKEIHWNVYLLSPHCSPSSFEQDLHLSAKRSAVCYSFSFVFLFSLIVIHLVGSVSYFKIEPVRYSQPFIHLLYKALPSKLMERVEREDAKLPL